MKNDFEKEETYRISCKTFLRNRKKFTKVDFVLVKPSTQI